MGLIYVATNKNNGKQYIGQTMRSLDDRKRDHFKGKGCRALVAAFKKYGIDAFEWKILHEGILIKSELNCLEIQEIVRLKTRVPYGYNLTDGGDGFDWDDPSFRARHRAAVGAACRTPSHRKNSSEAITRFYQDPENRKRMQTAVDKRKENPIWQHNLREGIKRRNERELWREKNAEAARHRSKSWHEKHASAMARVFGKPVLCVETGDIYPTAREAWRRTGVSPWSICQHLKGRSKSAGGFHWRYST